MNWTAIGVGAAWFAGGFVFASLAEYWGHRLLHMYRWLGKTHREHHARGTGQGVLLEYYDYVKGTWWMMWPPFLLSLPAGIGWFVGANGFAFFSAFAHQLQHENPRKCFWMRMPLHYVHHAHSQWHHNFGMAFDFWDRVFGTYEPTDWEQDLEPEQDAPEKHIWQINWLWGGNAEADRRREEEHRRKAGGERRIADAGASAGEVANTN
jgi:sterol desaturase/sphingolipid hydroxylase (fatty acid hydroxylase superfamily)